MFFNQIQVKHIAIIIFNDTKKWKCVYFFVNPVSGFVGGGLSTLKVFCDTVGSFRKVCFCIFIFGVQLLSFTVGNV